MTTDQQTVTNLKKITVHLQPDDVDGQSAETSPPAALTFIFGIGSSGLTEFEYQLVDKPVGDVVSIAFQRHQASNYFEHLSAAVLALLPDRNEFKLKATIADVQTAQDREVIKAMAKLAECDGECGCGCGA